MKTSAQKMTDKELEALSPWNENIKNVRKVTHSKYSRSKNCSLEKSQTAVFINILFYLALTNMQLCHQFCQNIKDLWRFV